MRKALFLVGLLGLTGCLTQETAHTLYLDPDGQISWHVLQREIRSVADDAPRRAEEEAEFLESAFAGTHAAAEALGALGARRVETRIVRDCRPYTVSTEGRLGAADEALERLFERWSLDAAAELRVEGELTRLTVRIRPGTYSGVEDDDPVVTLFAEPSEAYRIVLTAGRFVEARGFDLEEHDTRAVMRDPDGDAWSTDDEPIVFELAWTTAD